MNAKKINEAMSNREIPFITKLLVCFKYRFFLRVPIKYLNPVKLLNKSKTDTIVSTVVPLST